MNATLREVAAAYKEACNKIHSLIKASSYKITHIMEEIGLGRAAFYARLNAANWEPSHLEKFAAIFDSEPKRGGSYTTSAN